MTRHRPSPVPDRGLEEALTFTDVTILALLAVSAVAVAALILLGTVSAEHRIAAVLSHW